MSVVVILAIIYALGLVLVLIVGGAIALASYLDFGRPKEGK